MNYILLLTKKYLLRNYKSIIVNQQLTLARASNLKLIWLNQFTGWILIDLAFILELNFIKTLVFWSLLASNILPSSTNFQSFPSELYEILILVTHWGWSFLPWIIIPSQFI